MSYLDDLTAKVLEEIGADDAALNAARERRNDVMRAAEKFNGALRAYRSGSIAYGTAVKPRDDRDRGVDGDCGVVLSRTTLSDLGPDSDAKKGPAEVVEEMRQHLRAELCDDYPNLRVTTTEKRAIRITFREPLADDAGDPPVELVVALIRKDDPGLWIPNLKTNGWDPAHPEKHYQLIVKDPKKSLRVRRARAVRLMKWWNKRATKPGLSSFNIQALALEVLTTAEVNRNFVSSLHDFFAGAADRLEGGLTEDPAGVSGKLKLQNGATKDQIVERLRDAADALEAARQAPDDQQHVNEQLSKLFGEATVTNAAMLVTADALVKGNRRVVANDGRVEVAARGSAAARPVTSTNPSAWRAMNDEPADLADPGTAGAQIADALPSPLTPSSTDRGQFWWHDPSERQRFERDALKLARWLRGVPTDQGFEYRLFLPVQSAGLARYPTTFQVWVMFDRQNPAHAEVRTSPWHSLDPRWRAEDLPHRYEDDRLCLWYPHDPRSQRWEWDDGLLELLGHTGAHLLRERLWLQTGVWYGPEKPHGTAWDRRRRVAR